MWLTDDELAAGAAQQAAAWEGVPCAFDASCDIVCEDGSRTTKDPGRCQALPGSIPPRQEVARDA